MDESYRDLVSDRIRKSRELSGKTASKVAEDAGISESRWRNYECRVRTPNISLFPQMAAACGVTAAYMAGFTKHQGSTSDSYKFSEANAVRIAAGSDILAFNTEALLKKGLTARKLTLITARDSNLSPTINAGDDVLFDGSQTDLNVAGLFALQDKEYRLWLRWIRPEMNGSFTLSCNDKDRFPDQIMSAEELSNYEIIGRFVGVFNWTHL